MIKCPKCAKDLKIEDTYMSLFSPHLRRIVTKWAETLDIGATAKALQLSEHCVSVHLQRVRVTLGVKSHMDLMLLLYGLTDGAELGLELDLKCVATGKDLDRVCRL